MFCSKIHFILTHVNQLCKYIINLVDSEVLNGIFGKPIKSENYQEMSMAMHYEEETLRNIYTMRCPPVRGDKCNPRGGRGGVKKKLWRGDLQWRPIDCAF